MPVRLLCFFGDQVHWENVSRLLALPQGMSYDPPFRYRKEWMPPRLVRNLAAWQGSEVILCAKDSKDPDFYVPLRYAKIHSIRSEGEFHFFHFSTEEFVRYDETYRINHYSNAISGGIPSDEKKLLVAETELTAPIDKSSGSLVSSHWSVLTRLLVTDLLQRFPRVSELVFLRVLELLDADDEKVGRGLDKSRYRLKVDTEYKLKLIALIPKATERGLDVKPYEVKIVGPFTEETPRSYLAESPYEEVTLLFRTVAKKTSIGMSIAQESVEASDKASGAVKCLRVPKIEIPIRIAPSTGQVTSRTLAPITLIAVGVALQGLVSLLPDSVKPVTVTAGMILAAAGLYFKK